MKTKTEELTDLVARLNDYRARYYTDGSSPVSDAAYDRLYDELEALEAETGIIMSNSPTQTVGWKPVGNLRPVRHPIPLLSLAKTKDIKDLVAFMGHQRIMLMLKLDGLTIKLEYEGGRLVRASTRGDGEVGDDVTHNAPAISGVPLQIPYQGSLVVTGEAFIHQSDFEELKNTLLDSSGKPYRNARNLAAGSIRQLDPARCKERRLSFIPFNVLEGLDNIPDADCKWKKQSELERLGFCWCQSAVVRPEQQGLIQPFIDQLRTAAQKADIPIDGIVATYESVLFSKGCGRTGHHYKDGLAFKFEDEPEETVLRKIEWTPSRSGALAPVAVFDPVEMDGCEVSRASLSNLTCIRDLELIPGCRILVSKRNQIIPHVEDNLDRDGRTVTWPDRCPCCGQPTVIKISHADKLRPIETVCCNNPDCDTQVLRQFVHFGIKKAMDIDGLGPGVLAPLMDQGWLKSYQDLYHLDQHREEIIALPGFGARSFERLWASINASRSTDFAHYLTAMDIPMVGQTASRALAAHFEYDLKQFEEAALGAFDFSKLPNFGSILNENIHNWFSQSENYTLWKELMKEMTFKKEPPDMTTSMDASPIAGKTIVVTGTLEEFTRPAIHDKIERLGGKASGSVSKNTDYLVCGVNAGSKLAKARALGVPVLSEREFLEMIGD